MNDLNGLDSSTAILLEKSGLLEKAVSVLNVVITSEVREELGKPAGSSIFDTLPVVETPNDGESGRFGAGEQSILNLYRSGRISAVFSDDGRFLKYCRNESIPHYSALMVPFLLYNKGVFSRERALEVFEIIKGLGRYSEKIVSQALVFWKNDKI